DRDALAILKEAANNPHLDPTSDQMKAVHVFNTYLDFETRNRLGISPIVPTLERINAIKNTQDVLALITEKMPEGGMGFFGLFVGTDAVASNKNVIYISPGSTGLPDRDYFVSDDAASKDIKQKYDAHV